MTICPQQPRFMWLEMRAQDLLRSIHDRMNLNDGMIDITVAGWIAELNDLAEEILVEKRLRAKMGDGHEMD